jgi:hypothetical protein
MINERFKALNKVQNIYGKEYDFKGKVCISESGVVFVNPKGSKRGCIKIGRPAGGGHYQVSLRDEYDNQALFFIHRLVAYAWLRKPKIHKTIVMHRDDNPANNHYKNLMWGTQKDNLNQMRKNTKTKSFKQKYEDALIWEVYLKKENGASIKELQQQYDGIIRYSSIMHMTSGKLLRDRGLLPS